MAADTPAACFSYSRDDSEFALRLYAGLKNAGKAVWIDQVDIEPGIPWDQAVQDALEDCWRLLVILSPMSAKSDNVLTEIAFALEKQKRIIPILYQDCDVPFRLVRLQHIDFRNDYNEGFQALSRALQVVPPQPATTVEYHGEIQR